MHWSLKRDCFVFVICSIAMDIIEIGIRKSGMKNVKCSMSRMKKESLYHISLRKRKR